ncbi:MAG: hypothetical protein ISS19_08390 [Bacteroidales bacterium]|nr:hypothetical protein [Bacteroidales bacterium]
MNKKIYWIKYILLGPLFILLLYTCTSEKGSKQSITFLNDSRENYAGAVPRSLEQTEEPWHIKQVHEGWTDIRFARIFDYEGTEYLVYAQGDRENGFSLEVKSLNQNEIHINYIASDLQFHWSLLDNFRQMDDRVYFYTEDLTSYYFSLDSFNLETIEAYPFEHEDFVNTIVSPDGKHQVFWFNNTIYLKNLESGENEILWDDPGYDGMWSIGDLTWSKDSKKIFFDNSGGAACIWEIDLEKNTMNQLVPDHTAIHPFSFTKNGYDYVLYCQDTYIRIATKDPEASEYLDWFSIESGSYYLPLEEKYPDPEDSPLLLEWMPFKSVEQLFSIENASDWEDYSTRTTLWKVGTVMSEPYQAGIIYREENASWYKGGSDYSISRYIKYQDQVILLPHSSSMYSGYLTDSDIYETSLSDPSIYSELFAGCKKMIVDYQAAIEGIYIPEYILEVPEYFLVKFRDEILIDHSDEASSYHVNEPEKLKQKLEVAFADELAGEFFIEKAEDFDDKHSFFERNAGAIYAFTSDESVLIYSIEPIFTGSIPLDQEIDIDDYACFSDYGYVDDGGGALDYALWYTGEELFKVELHVLGTNSYGDTLWGNMETVHPVIQLEYERIKDAAEDFQYVDMEIPSSYNEFVQTVPMFYWKDPFGRYIRFISTDYLTPLLAEPIIYLYDDSGKEYFINLDNKVEVVSSIPEIKSGWNVKGLASGAMMLTRSGKEYEYLFWEGFAGFIPRLNTGFVVSREEVPEFFDEKLFELGLIDNEIEDFKEAWMKEFENDPYYLISFYDRQIIDKIAPLDLDPQPETIIRVLMDYKPLGELVNVTEPDLGTTPERRGTTLVEWGGLKRELREK